MTWMPRRKRHTPELPVKKRPEEFGGGKPRGGAYTSDQIMLRYCSRAGCGRIAHAQWSGCADENIQRPLCPECDVALNRLVLEWWGDPETEAKMRAYEDKVRSEINDDLVPVDSHERDVPDLFGGMQ